MLLAKMSVGKRIACCRVSDSGVRREGREREKIRRKRAREEPRSHLYPTPLVVCLFVFCSHVFALSPSQETKKSQMQRKRKIQPGLLERITSKSRQQFEHNKVLKKTACSSQFNRNCKYSKNYSNFSKRKKKSNFSPSQGKKSVYRSLSNFMMLSLKSEFCGCIKRFPSEQRWQFMRSLNQYISRFLPFVLFQSQTQ